MSKKAATKFGASGQAGNRRNPNLRRVQEGLIVDANTVTFTPDPGTMYLLFSREFNASSGVFRGERLVVISAPEEALYGTTACNHGDAYASANSGISIGYPTDSTITLARSSATYAVRYALYQAF